MRVRLSVATITFFCSCAVPAQVRPANPSVDPAGVFRLHLVSINDDQQHLGGEAYHILAPVDWRTEGGIIWKADPSNPAALWMRLVGPAAQEIGVLPSLAFVWNPRMLGSYFPTGSFYAGTEVQPPATDALQCIQRIVIPRYRRNLASAKIVKQEVLPELATAGRLKYPQPEYRNAVFQAGKVRFAYAENGKEMEEDVYVLTLSLQFPVGPTLSTAWALDEIRYSKAPKGALDSQLPLFQTAMFSLRPNVAWWAKVEQVQKILVQQQIQASNAAVEQSRQQAAAADRLAATSRSVAKAGDQINSMIMKGYQDRMSTMDNINARWDRTIRQVEVYHNPTTNENVELPSGYNTGWVNKSGEYLITPSVNYNPNAASNGAWTRLEKTNP